MYHHYYQLLVVVAVPVGGDGVKSHNPIGSCA